MDPSDPYAAAVQVVAELPPNQQAFQGAMGPTRAMGPTSATTALPLDHAGAHVDTLVGALPGGLPTVAGDVGASVGASAAALAPATVAAPVAAPTPVAPVPVAPALNPTRLLGGVVVNETPGDKTSTKFYAFNATNRIATMVCAIARVSFDTYKLLNIDLHATYTAEVEESVFQTLVNQYNTIVQREDLVINSDAFAYEGGLGVVLVAGLIPLNAKPGENVDINAMKVNSIPMGLETAKEWLPVLAATIDGREDHTLKSAIAAFKGSNVFFRNAGLNLYLFSIWLDPRLS